MPLTSCFAPSLPLAPPSPYPMPSPPPAAPLKRPIPPSPTSHSKRPRPPPSPPPSPSPSSPPTLLSTFLPLPFVPFLSSNPHLQTIVSHFYPPSPPLRYVRVSLPSDDGHARIFVDLAHARSLAPSDNPVSFARSVPALRPPHTYIRLPASPPVAVVLHGLESNADATVSRRIACALADRAFKTAMLNFRSCAGTADVPTTLRLYHAGFTEDLETLLRALEAAAVSEARRPPDVYLCGFSLGANVVCQFLGKWGANASDSFHVVAAAAACVPFDPVACQRKLDSGWTGVVYSSRLVATMQSKFRKAVEMGADIGDCVPEKIRKANRVGLVDEAFIAPVFGFKDSMDYYQKVDSRKVLKRITVPTLLINARDDPFFDHASGRSLPTPEQIGDAPVLLHITEHGGHCGFLDKEAFEKKRPCYFQREFARFFAHVRDARSKAGHNGNDAADAHEHEQLPADANVDAG